MLFFESDPSLVLVDELAIVLVTSPFIESSFGDRQRPCCREVLMTFAARPNKGREGLILEVGPLPPRL